MWVPVFNEDLGMSGRRRGLGEETELFTRIWHTEPDATFVYLPELLVYHEVPRSRMRIRYRLWRSFIAGVSSVEMRKPLPVLRRVSLAILETARTVWAIGQSLKRLPTKRLPKKRLVQRWLAEDLRAVVGHLGKIAGLLGLRPIIHHE